MVSADQIAIRPLATNDRKDWQRLWQGYLEFYATTRPAEIYDTTFARLLSDSENEFRCLLALVNDKPVGLAHFLSHRHCWHQNNVLYLQDLFVDPDIRGKGIGRALIATIKDIAAKENAPSLYWLTQDTNSAAQALYDQIADKPGFIKYQISLG